jgi:hypothetical protein
MAINCGKPKTSGALPAPSSIRATTSLSRKMPNKLFALRRGASNACLKSVVVKIGCSKMISTARPTYCERVRRASRLHRRPTDPGLRRPELAPPPGWQT